MKLENLIPQRYRCKSSGSSVTPNSSGCPPNGRYELIGGMDADRIDAIKWVSLFAHEIVFTHFRRKGGRLPFIPATVPIQTAARDVNNLGWLDGWLTPSSSWWYGWNMLGKGCFQRGIKNGRREVPALCCCLDGRKIRRD